MDVKDIENRFAFHAATTEAKRNVHENIRRRCGDLARWLNEALPEGREKALAVTHLEETMFWANGAWARTGDS